ncbi:hypothetical protein WAI453_011316 [Rhynchosporium graminicola]
MPNRLERWKMSGSDYFSLGIAIRSKPVRDAPICYWTSSSTPAFSMKKVLSAYSTNPMCNMKRPVVGLAFVEDYLRRILRLL